MKLDEEILKGKQYIDKLRREYIENHTRFQERDELIAENNIEKRDIKGYHGREILELLQNADDAYQKSIDKGEKDNAEKYKLIIVYDVDAEEPKCMELPMRFWEDSKFRKREIVERIEFEF